MNETTFWQMIEQAKIDSGGDGEEQVNLLVERLAQLEVSEIVDFDFLFDTYHAAAYRRDVWEAGTIAYGFSLSDDSFTDFRAWLIAQGRDTYEQVLSDPDWLAQVVTVSKRKIWGKGADIKLEDMNYVAIEAYEIKMGEDENMPHIAVEEPDLTGEWSSQDELPLKYPNLWRLFQSSDE
jgi:hypothetical protein